MPKPEFQPLPEPDIIYDCQSGQAVAIPDIQRAELRFVTVQGKLIAVGLTGRVLVQVREKIDELLAESPEIADWAGGLPH